jgi:hypothetical protein
MPCRCARSCQRFRVLWSTSARRPLRTARALRAGTNFLNASKLICAVQPCAKKEMASRETQISPRTRAIPARKRGVSRSSRTLGWVAVDAKAPGARQGIAGRVSRERCRRARRMAQLRTAKACGSGTRGWCQAGGDWPGPTGRRGIVNSSAMEARGIRLQGERVISRQTIAQGRPDAPADTCMLVCVFLALIAHETSGASQHPAFPAPSDFLGA